MREGHSPPLPPGSVSATVRIHHQETALQEIAACDLILFVPIYRKPISLKDLCTVSYKQFKFREDKSNNVFREILKCFRKTVKSEFFAKQIIYLESPDHPLQNDIWYVRVLRV